MLCFHSLFHSVHYYHIIFRTVDENTQYDDLVQESRDAEEQYFDDDSDEEMSTNREGQLSYAPLADDEYDY